jgi:hypothetical protein
MLLRLWSVPSWCLSLWWELKRWGRKRWVRKTSVLMVGLMLGVVYSAVCFSDSERRAHGTTFSISGAVLKPGEHPWHTGARLHDATVAGYVRADAWFLGAALLRQDALEPQQRLKVGVLFDLRVNHVHARATGNDRLQALLQRLEDQITALPVTGRVKAQLNPFQLLILKNNPLLHPGDHLIYPLRPTQVRVMGAVQADCELSFDPALALKHYLRQCPAHVMADRDVAYVIQPDGHIDTVGIAHWNQQTINIAVGAIIYRPIKPAKLSPETPDFNRELATFLATQYPLGGHFNE